MRKRPTNTIERRFIVQISKINFKKKNNEEKNLPYCTSLHETFNQRIF